MIIKISLACKATNSRQKPASLSFSKGSNETVFFVTYWRPVLCSEPKHRSPSNSASQLRLIGKCATCRPGNDITNKIVGIYFICLWITPQPNFQEKLTFWTPRGCYAVQVFTPTITRYKSSSLSPCFPDRSINHPPQKTKGQDHHRSFPSRLQ
jgi:hypothetical protein